MSDASETVGRAAAVPAGPVARGHERRRTTRVPTDALDVRLDLGARTLTGRVCDVSRGGLRIAVDAAEACDAGLPPVAVGARVTVHHGALGEPLQGLCVRCGPGEIGVAFDGTVGEVERTLQCLALVLADGG